MKRSNLRLAITLSAGLTLAILILEEGQIGPIGDRYDDTRSQLFSAVERWLE